MAKTNKTAEPAGFSGGDNFRVRDIGLAPQGRKKIEWAESRMPVLMALREKFSRTRPLK